MCSLTNVLTEGETLQCPYTNPQEEKALKRANILRAEM